VLWGTLDAYNYNNVVWWAFRDDGAVEGRYGATALNLPGSENVAHMHTPIWRLDIDLDGFQGDSVHVANHVESGASATDSSTLVSKEAGLEWKADEFTTLHIHDSALKNGNQSSMYHLMPLRWGRPRHQESFTQNDFWVTLYRGSEIWAKGRARLRSQLGERRERGRRRVVHGRGASPATGRGWRGGQRAASRVSSRDVDQLASEAAQSVRSHAAIRTAGNQAAWALINRRARALPPEPLNLTQPPVKLAPTRENSAHSLRC
jgi:hypothetical protein